MAKRGPSEWNRKYGFKVMEWRNFKRGIKSFFCILSWLIFSMPMRYPRYSYKRRGFLGHLLGLFSSIRRLFSGNRRGRMTSNPLSKIKSSTTKRGVTSQKAASQKVKKGNSQSKRKSLRLSTGKNAPVRVKSSNVHMDKLSSAGYLRTDKNSQKKLVERRGSTESKKDEISAVRFGVAVDNEKKNSSFYKEYDGFYQSEEAQSLGKSQSLQLPSGKESVQYSGDGNPFTIEETGVYKLSILQDGEQDVKPITNGDKTLGTLWKENVESFFSEYIAELQEGKRLVDAVKNLRIAKGRITAEVKEEDKVAYKVIVTIEPLTETECRTFYDSGENQKDLFPSKKDFWLFCNCDIEKKICPHMMATLYAVGTLIEEDERAIYRLRGIKA